MNTTINAFPPVHAFNSSRSWVLALIVLIHLGFFWALTSGLARSIITHVPYVTHAFVSEERPQPPPTPREIPDVPLEHRVYVPIIDEPRFIPDVPSDTAPLSVTHERQELPPITETLPVRPAPVEVMPQIDQRRGLSEPEYPPSMIRSGAEGTVILSVQVLENGRVGDVRVERSSGFPKLDESAIREARRWRLIPGTRDGVPVVLWKQIPITFRLQGER